MRRVSDRLRTLSATRLAAPPGPSPDGGPPCVPGRGRPGRRPALARRGRGPRGGRREPGAEPPGAPHLPVLADLAVGDQVAVTGHDLLAALDRGASRAVRGHREQPACRDAGRALADVRRRL